MNRHDFLKLSNGDTINLSQMKNINGEIRKYDVAQKYWSIFDQIDGNFGEKLKDGKLDKNELNAFFYLLDLSKGEDDILSEEEVGEIFGGAKTKENNIDFTQIGKNVFDFIKTIPQNIRQERTVDTPSLTQFNTQDPSMREYKISSAGYTDEIQAKIKDITSNNPKFKYKHNKENSYTDIYDGYGKYIGCILKDGTIRISARSGENYEDGGGYAFSPKGQLLYEYTRQGSLKNNLLVETRIYNEHVEIETDIDNNTNKSCIFGYATKFNSNSDVVSWNINDPIYRKIYHGDKLQYTDYQNATEIIYNLAENKGDVYRFNDGRRGEFLYPFITTTTSNGKEMVIKTNVDVVSNNPLTIAQQLYLDSKKISILQDIASYGIKDEADNIFSKHIDNYITKDNVFTVLQIYNSISDKGSLYKNVEFFNDILENKNLSEKSKNQILEHLMNLLLDYANNKGIKTNDIKKKCNKLTENGGNFISFVNKNPPKQDYWQIYAKILCKRIVRSKNHDSKITNLNGKIDKHYKQGNTGDCWLISSIIALNQSPKGQKIINDSLQCNDDGSITVTLKGVNKRYKITREEIEANIQMANGDGDVRAIEIAFNRYFEEKGGVNGHLDIEGNTPLTAFKILIGSNNIDRIEKIDDDLIDSFNNKNKITIVATNRGTNLVTKSSDSRTIKLITNHAYAIVKADKKYVYLINPWNSSEELRVSRDVFKSFFTDCNQVELE